MNGVSNTLRSSSNSAVQKKATMTDSTVANGTAAQSPHADCVDTDIRVLDKSVAGPSTGMPTRFILEPVKASRVLKGEIHNLLTVMRAEEYVSPQRFVEEFDPIHPLAAKLEHVHNLLGNNNQMDPLLLRTYLRPFCEAVKGRDIRAPVTGAALSALHKFLLYGFVVPSQSEASSVLTMIAECLLECRFEEPDDPKSRTANTKVSLNASRATHGALTPAQQEEQVVLKLLDLAALTVRCSLQDVALLSANLMVGLLETCLHVSHHAKRASPLLKSAAADALGQIVLQVFAASGGPALEARHQILCKLAWLLNPSHQTPHVTMTSLTLINIALETCQEELSDADVAILQDDLCKYLLLASTTHDLYILNLTLRVIFNLFQSIRNHLKVPLEVFLTSVHLRILEAPVMEEREVALESLLEFCQEPELMQDIYLNYDCDVACTNLFESIVHSLGKVALPTDYKFGEEKNSTSAGNSGSKDNASSAQVVNVTSTHTSHPSSVQVEPAPLNHLNRLALEGLLAILDSIAKRCTDAPLGREQVGRTSSAMSVTSDDCLTGDDESTGAHLETAPVSSLRRQKTDEELRETKLRKKSLAKVAQAFNDRPMGTAWIEIAIEENVLTDKDNVEGVAKLLYTAPGLDKVELGIYLSKGPDSDYPFIVAVRKQFVGLFDFHGLKFAGAIRKFLSKFRLPGEAQCIDRLMESFSAELYNQQGAASFFANADAVYVMSFSTIMLNTDLHNPHIASQNRMTLKQFIKNNKGINGGKDLPEEFLTDLYEEIRKKQIQVRKEMGEIMRKHENVDFRTAWEGIMSKAEEVQRPFFGPSDGSRRQTEAGLHDKEMFEILSKWLLADLVGVYLRSWDDALVVKALNGLKQMTKVAAHFDLDETVNDVLEALLPMGRDYVMGCVALDFEKLEEENNDDNSVMSGSRTLDSVEANSQDGTAFGADQPIPYSLLCSSNKLGRPDIYGSAAHRGILALDCSFVLLQQYGSRVSSAWPSFIECLCALRDARALPAGLADLDDFADSNGNVLPLSPFAKESNQRLKHFYCAQQDDTPAVSSPKGWLRSLFKKRDARDVDSIADDASYNYSKRELSTYAKALLGIAEAADVENVIQMGSTKLPAAEQTIESLLVTVSNYPYQDDPVLEQHAIFSLELAARALLSNRNRAPRLYPLFLDTFEKILGKVSDARVPAPFVVERIVVTVLRACIHLYDLPELRPNLRSSLHLLTMVLPRTFVKTIADRMSCGLAIILRASFHFFETPNEWTFMGDTLDMMAHYGEARVFVFDGIASTVEYAIPQLVGDVKENGDTGDRAKLSKDACSALARILIRFILGFYQNDISLVIPAMLCLEKVYRYHTEVVLAEMEKNGEETTATEVASAAPDAELWQNVAVALYSVCRSTDPDTSRRGVECYQRIVLQTSIEQIPDEKWIAILHLMVNKQPPLVADESRVNTFSALGQLFCKLIPTLSKKLDNHEDLYDLVNSYASLAAENLREGRKGSVSPLFESTLQTVTYLSNHMTTEDWDGEPEFSAWASETLIVELEKVGAAGASSVYQAATQKSNTNNHPITTSKDSATEITEETEPSEGEHEDIAL